ncbi:MAG: hypothetical protein COX34_01760 [Candidatus Nealsonbacteria bacterium CG23_combo_of_CG06-09_8_20_14_all_36_12]|uniref:Uncharacterized protein n=1 Tax=Candidatus Nealsonbacteria bacterium CG23_combo_of_CG06-09_8_20_14_all_36_12 TaxID=1974718 RepID=A0A2G9Z076_9BACT|nr:MAG: hypothetical protein COX34_01760 [Candidatus Nealsonbacteria bacterium CG23_combo_of_CG06-09_8_20_14_all_36_12]
MKGSIENDKFVVWGDHVVETVDDGGVVVKRGRLKITRLYPQATKEEKEADLGKVIENFEKEMEVK